MENRNAEEAGLVYGTDLECVAWHNSPFLLVFLTMNFYDNRSVEANSVILSYVV